MTDLKTFIEAMNAETRAWVADGPDRWATEFHTDMDMWADSGIYTVEDFNTMLDAEYEREMRKSAYYDDDEYTTLADRNYFDNDSYDDVDYSYEEFMLHQEMKKFGVDTAEMIPTHFEQMANAAGYLEY